MIRCSCLLMLLIGPAIGDASSRASERPNILIVLADDLGFSDLGCYGGEIQTPHLDELAASGIRFSQFYNTGRCWPTRGSLLTGFYAQQIRRDKLPGIQSGAGGQRPAWARLVSETLQSHGYRTYHSGKWHIDGMPLQNGFDRSYYLSDQGRFFSPGVHYEDDQKLPPVQPETGYYGTVAIADHAVKCLEDHAANHPDQPFFHYLAFTAPHFPLHALPQDIQRYQGRYEQGWEHLRAERWQRLGQSDIVRGGLSEVEGDVGPPYHFPEALETLGSGEVNRPLPWNSLTESQQQFQATKMTLHAAMVDRLDRELGRVLEQIKSMGAWDETLIIFLSDNGASAEIMVRDDGHDPLAPPGSAATYLCLGPGWSTVANTPFRRHKTWVHEGGIATPCIIHWPDAITTPGKVVHQVGHVVDIVPTLLDVLGVVGHGAGAAHQPPPRPGQSLKSTFDHPLETQHRRLWWSHEGNRAFRDGDWKLVAAGEEGSWELYDLGIDRTETNNLAQELPDRVEQMAQEWRDLETAFIKIASAELAESKDKPQLKSPRQDEQQKPVKELILPGESFLIEDRPAFILHPKNGLREQDQPWVMYAPTLPPYPDAHEKWMHQQFVNAGIAVVGIDIGEAYGSPQGQRLFDALYQELTEKRNFAAKAVLLGRSRGGLWVTSWAKQHPDRVAGLAGIYPVFDLRSYPGIEQAAPAYGLTAAELGERLPDLNPINAANVLAKAKIPVFLIHGDSDEVVPLESNSAEFRRRYVAEGEQDLIQLDVAEGQGHNLWKGFFQCQPLIDFVIERTKADHE